MFVLRRNKRVRFMCHPFQVVENNCWCVSFYSSFVAFFFVVVVCICMFYGVVVIVMVIFLTCLYGKFGKGINVSRCIIQP